MIVVVLDKMYENDSKYNRNSLGYRNLARLRPRTYVRAGKSEFYYVVVGGGCPTVGAGYILFLRRRRRFLFFYFFNVRHSRKQIVSDSGKVPF